MYCLKWYEIFELELSASVQIAILVRAGYYVVTEPLKIV